MPPRSRTTSMTSFLQTDPLTPRVVAKFKERNAMAVVLRNVADHNWGWFSREDERMHLQTVEKEALTGSKRVKVWLEDRGKRICTLADGKLTGTDLKKLQAKVKAERVAIEERWIDFMIAQGWLTAEMAGSVVTLTAYPKSHNKFTRTLDLRDEFPGAYSDNEQSWDRVQVFCDLDQEHNALAVGTKKNMDDRNHIRLTDLLFID